MADKSKIDRKWVKTPEAARMLGVKVNTIRKWLKDGSLRGKKIGSRFFIFKADLDGINDNKS